MKNIIFLVFLGLGGTLVCERNWIKGALLCGVGHGLLVVSLRIEIIKQWISKQIREMCISDKFRTNLDLLVYTMCSSFFVYWVGFETAMTLQTHFWTVNFIDLLIVRFFLKNVLMYIYIVPYLLQFLLIPKLYVTQDVLIAIAFLYGMVPPTTVNGWTSGRKRLF